MVEFKDLLTLASLHDFARDAGFVRPTAVQRAAIPRLLDGRSVSVLAQTGSGKTLAYALPVVEILKKLEGAAPHDEATPGAPRAWIIYPTRELGTQIEKVFKLIAHRAKLRVRHLRGGEGRHLSRDLTTAPVDVVISSAHRALNTLTSHELRANATRIVIFDEADQLFDRGFLPDVQRLFARLRHAELQVGLFSATMPPTFAQLRRESFPGVDFDEVILQGSHTLRDNIATENHTVPYKDKLQHSLRLLKKAAGPGLVFVNLKRTAAEVFAQLTAALPAKKVHLLHGDVDRRERRKVLSQFAAEGDLLVCTDIAARGLDLPHLCWILNYDLPFEAVYYVHRCGRIGRSGQPARVYNLVTSKDRPLIARINVAIENQASVKLSRVAVREAPAPEKRAKAKPSRRAPKSRPGRRRR